MTHPHRTVGDLDLLSSDDVFAELVLTREEDRDAYLKQEWIDSILAQLVRRRTELHMTQKELGSIWGKPQSSIARIESGDDIKLSVVWEYLAATGLVPVGEIPTQSIAHARDRLSRYLPCSSTAFPPVPRYRHWVNQVVEESPLSSPPAPPLAEVTPSSTPAKGADAKTGRERQAAA